MNTESGMDKYQQALASARELAQGGPLTIDVLLKAAQPFGLHRGATFIELIAYVERETGGQVVD